MQKERGGKEEVEAKHAANRRGNLLQTPKHIRNLQSPKISFPFIRNMTVLRQFINIYIERYERRPRMGRRRKKRRRKGEVP